MQDLTTPIATDVWVTVSWDKYIQLIDNPVYNQARCYYHDGQLRIEMSPIGYDHAANNNIIGFAVNLYAIFANIPLTGVTNCSFRKSGLGECQPDAAYYLGRNAQAVPAGTRIVNLNQYPPPDLAIEIGDTSIADDLDRKKRLYEQLPVSEYWVVNVSQAKISAFAIANGESQPLAESKLLPGLAIDLLEEMLQRSRTSDQTRVGAWLLQQFQKS